jgi:hypothetical protein
VYRGCAIPDLSGAYFFADYCVPRIWSLRFDGAVRVVTEHTDELRPAFPDDIINITSFGRDTLGEVYICDHADGEVFKIVPSAAPPAIISALPPDGSIDARQPSEPYGSAPDGWRSVELTFNGSAACLGGLDFRIEQVGGSLPWPSVLEVTPVGPSAATVTLDRRLWPVARTRIIHLGSGSSVDLAWLPGDVNGSGTSDPADLAALIPVVAGQASGDPWSTDIDRSGVTAPADIIRQVDLLLGGGVFEAYQGATLP